MKPTAAFIFLALIFSLLIISPITAEEKLQAEKETNEASKEDAQINGYYYGGGGGYGDYGGGWGGGWGGRGGGWGGGWGRRGGGWGGGCRWGCCGRRWGDGGCSYCCYSAQEARGYNMQNNEAYNP